MANSGTDVVMIDASDSPLSSLLPSRMPASTPMVSDSGTMMENAIAAMRAVLPKRGQIKSLTVNVLSDTSRRSQSTRRLRRIRVRGKAGDGDELLMMVMQRAL